MFVFEKGKKILFLTYNIAEMAIPEALHQLGAYDKENGSNLLAHLKIYLCNERNIAESAKAAFIHRNTFIYQINKIKQLTNLNLDDYEERLKLMIAFKGKDM